jgi:hypothetical protein
MDFTELTALEREALELLLSAPTVSARLKEQGQSAKVIHRDYTGVGVFISLRTPDELQGAEESFTISSLAGEMDGLIHRFGGDSLY